MSEYNPTKVEQKWQKRWAEAKVFEANVEPEKKKFMTTFPIVYLNGNTHAGHGYTCMKVDAYARYKRMLGYNVIFPQGWHATGQPIQGVAERLKKGDEVQERILKQSGVSEDELEKFTDPLHISNYYKTLAKRDFCRMGFSIDWRREFVTTTLCPTFSRFIEWQYETLRSLDYVSKGTHPVVWCPHCESPTGDHDRLKGEGVTAVEFTLIKFPFNDGYLVPATLRPETIFGVTNMWIHPKGDYVEAEVDGEKWFISQPTVIKLRDQLHEVKVNRKFKGIEIIGKTCHAPIRDEEIKILPATFVDIDHTTGVVMSVPSHAPFDYVALRELKQHPDRLTKYDLPVDFAEDIDLISMIETPGLGKHPAKDIIEDMAIESQDDSRTEEATQQIYKKEFHAGVMKVNCGKYAGIQVSKIKDLLIKDLLDENISDSLWEPSDTVICRCSTKNHVKILKDQWFIKYGNPDWKKQTRKHLDEKMTIFPSEARQAFEYTIEWLNDKACARKSGLGTPLPWDPQWIVETLSDSTVYMAYYTISRIINEQNITADQLPNELFDYLFRNKGKIADVLKKTTLTNETIEAMKREFNYFYPPDFRASAKELIFNHLTFYIFQHIAIFPKKYWPIEIEGNGMIMIEGDKMSKSTGNSVSLHELMDRFNVDATRFGLAYCGEGYADASFRYDDADAAQKRLKWLYHELTASDFTQESHRIDRWIISRLQERVRETREHFAHLRTRSAISAGFFGILNDLKWYENRSGEQKGPGYREALLTLVDLMTPIIPFFAEEINEVVRKDKDRFASLRPFPEVTNEKIDQQLEAQEQYIKNTKEDIAGILKAIRKQETKSPSQIRIFIAPDWMYEILAIRRKNPDNLIKTIMSVEEIRKKGNDAVKYAKNLVKSPGFDFQLDNELELEALTDAIDYFKREFNVKEVTVIPASESNHPKAKVSEPGRPGIAIEFS
ncbi:MAG: leucine--tRNA ligase [Candidatus Heimdallarchaeota archaeon]|nr:leucine--tRNA ligase [Candidatus Heimdallarchaeota archaeon]